MLIVISKKNKLLSSNWLSLRKIVSQEEWFLKCLEYIFEIVVNPNVSMVNSKSAQTKEN